MESLEARLQAGWQQRTAHFPRELYCAYPVKTRAVSVTGANCELQCSHCGGHYLQAMTPLDGLTAKEHDATSLLISGGCDRSGKVPIVRHVEALQRLSCSKRLNLHVGLVDAGEVEAIARVADKVSFDFIGDDETIREVLGLEKSVAAYVDCYRMLRRRCSVIPHICIGLRGGEISGEFKALELLKEIGLDSLVFIVFTPTPGTHFAHKQPPPIQDVLAVLLQAREEFPDVHLGLGCLRPGGRYRAQLDPLAVKAGINSIVNPVPAAVRLAQDLGLRVVKREECCAFA